MLVLLSSVTSVEVVALSRADSMADTSSAIVTLCVCTQNSTLAASWRGGGLESKKQGKQAVTSGGAGREPFRERRDGDVLH